jgi:hypothetical protein
LLRKITGRISGRLKSEGGYASIIALLIFIVGLLLVPPLLDLVGNGREITRQVYDDRISQQYAVDAGVAKAMWYIKYNIDSVPTSFSINVNNLPVSVTISQQTQADNSTNYSINATAKETVINSRINYTAAVQEIPPQPSTYLFGQAVASGLGGNISLTGGAKIYSDSGKMGNVFSGNNLILSPSGEIYGNVYARSNVSLDWSTRIEGNAVATGTITKKDSNSISGSSTPNATSQDPPALSDSDLNSIVQSVYNNTYNLAALTPGGTTYTSGLTISGQTNKHYSQMNVQGNLVLQNSNSNIVFDGQVYVTGNLNVSGSQTVTFSQPVYIGGQLVTSGSGSVAFQGAVSAGSVNLGGLVGVTFSSGLKVLGACTVGAGISTPITGSLYVGGDLSYSGATSLNITNGIYIKGNMTLSGSSQIVGPNKVVVRGNLTLSGSTQLTSAQIPYIILPPARIIPALPSGVDPSIVTLSGSSICSGVLYAPTAGFNGSGTTKMNGSLICKSVTLTSSSMIIYSTGLTGRGDLPHTDTPGTPGSPASYQLMDWSVR